MIKKILVYLCIAALAFAQITAIPTAAGGGPAGGAGNLTNANAVTCVSSAGVIKECGGTSTLSGHLTIEGVTSSGATGTGSFVFATSPTFAGTAVGANYSVTGAMGYRSGATEKWHNQYFSGGLVFTENGVQDWMQYKDGGIFESGSGVSHAWSSDATGYGTIDTTLCRSSAGVLRIGASTGCASSGSLLLTGLTASGAVSGGSYATATNCASSASPATCSAAPAGAAVIAAAATSVVVNTTAVTANSEITITEDASLGSRLSVTCNTQSSLTLGTPRVSARVAGTSFTVIVDVAPTTNPLCFNYKIVN